MRARALRLIVVDVIKRESGAATDDDLLVARVWARLDFPRLMQVRGLYWTLQRLPSAAQIIEARDEQ